MVSMGGHGAVDGFPTPLTNRRTGHEAVIERTRGHVTSESEDSGQSPANERRGMSSHHGHLNGGHISHVPHSRPKTLLSDLVDSGLSTLTQPDTHRSIASLSLEHSCSEDSSKILERTTDKGSMILYLLLGYTTGQFTWRCVADLLGWAA